MKKPLFFAVIVLLGASFFSGCTSTKLISESDFSPIYITNVKKFYLLPPDCIESDVEVQQLLTANFGEKTMSLLSYLQADKQGIFLSLFNDFGTGMGTLSYDGMKVNFDSAIFPKNLKAEYILADLQFAYYSVAELKKALHSIRMKITVDKGDNPASSEVRRIYNGPFLIEEVIKEPGTIVIHNKLRGYEYTLQEASE